MDKALTLLGIAKKAGLLAVGGDAVAAAARSGIARLVLSAADSSTGARIRAGMNAKACGAVYLSALYTKFELGQIAGRGEPGTIGILDAGLAASFLKKISDGSPGKYEDDVRQLEEEARATAARTKTRATAAPTKTRATAAPTKTRATAAPTKTRAKPLNRKRSPRRTAK